MKAVSEGKMRKILFSLLLCCALIVSCVPATNHTSVQAADPLIVMLDPGTPYTSAIIFHSSKRWIPKRS